MKKIALVRGKFLNAYEMQTFEPLVKRYDITAFGSFTSFQNNFAFPTVQLASPVDIPDFPKKMPILNRMFVDAHYLLGLEERLKRFDIVHTAETYFRYTQQALDAKKNGNVKKVVATVLENIPFNNEGIWGRSMFKERFRKEIDHCIALSERAKQTLIVEGMDAGKISVVGYGIDTMRFAPDKAMLDRIGRDTNHMTILFTGRLELSKGIFEILYAAKLLLEDKKLHEYTLEFIFVGNGSQKQHMLQVVKKLGIEKHITITSLSYEEMPNIYRKADIFVAPSKEEKYWQEQYCIALLEAQATGLPIVTTSSGSILENVGDAAVLVGSADFYGLYRALKDFILHPKLRTIYSKKALERTKKVHDAKIVAEKIARVYENI